MSTSVPPPGFPDATPAPPAPDRRGSGDRPGRARSPRARLLAGLAVLGALIAVAFAAFGSGSGGPLSDPIAQAATLTSSTPGFRMHMAVEVSYSAQHAPITATVDGIDDLRHRASSMSLTLDLGGLPAAQALGGGQLTMAMVQHGPLVYMRLPPAAMTALPSAGKPWIEFDAARAAGLTGSSSLLSGAGQDPAKILGYLRSLSDSVADAGPQIVDGVPTTHYRAQLDFDRAAANLPSQAQQAIASFERLLPSHTIPLDVWVDSHHLLRRFAAALTMAAGSHVASFSLTADLFDYGPQRPIAAPPANQVQDLTSLAAAAR